MLRLDAALYEVVKGGAHVAKHVFGARDRAFGARDAAKVEALRLAIMDGNYPLDAKRIAENMLNLERLIG